MSGEELEQEVVDLRKALNATTEDMRTIATICRNLKEEANIYRDAIKSVLDVCDGDWSGVIFTIRFAGDLETASKIENCINELKRLIEVADNET